jgi:RNA polymerase sigma-70 factor (ECF subfamily)
MDKGNPPLLDTDRWLEDYGDYLFRYAFTKLKDTHLAEDMVQETFIAAFAARERFSARASVRTWLTTIMNHKIVDHWRSTGKEITVSDLMDPADNLSGADEFFDHAGQWADIPNPYPKPEAALENKQFWKIFEHCLSRLKPQQAEVFLAKEVHGLSNDEICKSHALSASNVWVLLHRARLALSKCLELYWAK